ncbi:MAG TPA: hypothetical protein VK540_13960 [Polyangiaceae bacterium]|nr:hypothetical protein [Polyangiaceae bacterium]
MAPILSLAWYFGKDESKPMGDLWRESAVVAASVTASVGAVMALWRMKFDRKLTDYRAELDRELEHAKGEIRRDVERDLRYQESRLRVAAEIELRLHEREWTTLEDVTRAFGVAAQEMDRALTGLMTADKKGTVLTEWTSAKYEGGLRLLELRALLPRVPDPFHAEWEAIVHKLEEIRKSISGELEKHLMGARGTITAPWCELQFERGATAREAATSLQRRWRAKLGKANGEILSELEKSASGGATQEG